MKKTKLLLNNPNPINSLLAILLFTFLFIDSQAQNYTWTDMPPLSTTLYAPASFSIGSNIYFVSGWAVSEYAVGGYPAPMNYSVWQFNTTTNTWSQKNNFPGTQVYGASGFSIGNYGYVVNGWDSTGSDEGPSATWQYDPSTDTWSQKAPFPGSTRYTTANFALNGKGYVACGFKPYVNDVWCYDPIGDSWSQKNNFPGSARQAMSYFVIGGNAYAGMGATSDGMGSYFIESDWYNYRYLDIIESISGGCSRWRVFFRA